jgi:Tfp pilus assembly protein PilP
MHKIFLSLILCVLVLQGCTQNITLDLPSYENKVAVFCLLSPDSLPKMYLNLSKSYYAYADTTPGYRFVKSASVTITDQSKNTIDTLHLDSAIEGFSNTFTWFYRGKKRINAGDHYIANIKYGGKILTAETTVPLPVTMDHYYYKKSVDTFGMYANYEFHVFFNDRADESNSYTLSAFPPIGFHNIHEYNFSSDAGFNGKQMEAVYYYSNQQPNDSFSIGFTIDNATPQTDKYITDVYNQQGSYQDPFTEPVVIESNVTGGLGLFGAIAPSPMFTVKVK